MWLSDTLLFQFVRALKIYKKKLRRIVLILTCINLSELLEIILFFLATEQSLYPVYLLADFGINAVLLFYTYRAKGMTCRERKEKSGLGILVYKSYTSTLPAL